MSIRNSLICLTLLMAMLSACATSTPNKDGGVYAILELTVHDEQISTLQNTKTLSI